MNNDLEQLQIKFLPHYYKVFREIFPEDIPQFTKGTSGSAGYDLYPCIETPLALWPGERRLIPTGISIFIENPNIASLIIPRSGRGHKEGLVIGNLVGLIDSDYQNEWFISAWNTGDQKITLYPNKAIAQAIFIPVIHPNFNIVEEFTESSSRFGGFGSTDKKEN